MAERSLIHVGGSPGSGKSRMARALVDRLHTTTELRAEHISIGDQVRALGRGAIESVLQEYINLHLASPHTTNDPLEDSAILEILISTLDAAARREADVIFLDGYPRYAKQIDTYLYQAELYGYDTPGALIAETKLYTAFERIMKRGRSHQERSTDPVLAWNKIILHNASYPAVIRQLGAHSTKFDIHRIDTSGSKEQTDTQAFEATMQLINESLPKSA